MCTKICGSNLRSMSSGKVIHTQMLALVALPRIFFIFASFFSVRLCYLYRRFLFSLSLDWTFLYGGTLGPLQPLDFFATG